MSTLLERTRELLKEEAKSRTLMEIHKETELPFYWLRKVASGETKDPSVNRIQTLYEHLSGKKLELK
jgi:hypothetical protein